MTKKLLSLMFALLTIGTVCAQPRTASFKPGPAAGQDVTIFRMENDCVFPGYSVTPADQNHDGTPQFQYCTWTWYAAGCAAGSMRSLLRFDGLSAIPPYSRIQNASLLLHGVPSGSSSGGNSMNTATPNNGLLQRVTGAWTENTVTWNTQPAITTAGQIAIPVAASAFNWDMAFSGAPITAMVQNMIGGPANNNGFLLRLATEVQYRNVVFASSDHPDSSLWPELKIDYYECGDFEYCYPTNNQYLYTFTALNPSISGATYQWTINGNLAGSGTVLTVDIRTISPATNPDEEPYTVCLKVVNSTTGAAICSKCNDICALKHGQNEPSNSASFRICSSSSAPATMQMSPLSPAPGSYTWYNYANGVNAPPVWASSANPLVLTPGIFPSDHTVIELQHSTGTRNRAFVCLYDNPPRPAATGNETPEGAPIAPGTNIWDLRDKELLNAFRSKIKVSPNPSSGDWSVLLDVPKECVVQITLCDVTGRQVDGQKQMLQKGSNKISLSGHDLATGIYLLEVSSDLFSIREKLIRN